MGSFRITFSLETLRLKGEATLISFGFQLESLAGKIHSSRGGMLGFLTEPSLYLTVTRG